MQCNVSIYIYWHAAVPFVFVQCISKVCRVESAVMHHFVML